MTRIVFIYSQPLCFFILLTGSIGCQSTPVRSAAPTPSMPERPNTDTIDQLGMAVFTALKQGDEFGFQRLIATPEQMKDFAQRLGWAKRAGSEKILKRFFEGPSKLRAQFKRFRQHAEAAGLRWQGAQFLKMQYRIGTKNGVSGSDARMLVQVSGKVFTFMLDDVIKGPSGWVLTDKLIWSGIQSSK